MISAPPPTCWQASFPKTCNPTLIWRSAGRGPQIPGDAGAPHSPQEGFKGNSKDYEFSRLSMTEHWASGVAGVKGTLSHKASKHRRSEKPRRVIASGRADKVSFAA